MKNHYHHDVLVIGSGAAGLTLALNLSAVGNIAVISIHEGHTRQISA